MIFLTEMQDSKNYGGIGSSRPIICILSRFIAYIKILDAPTDFLTENS
jgi:hypothetical protein